MPTTKIGRRGQLTLPRAVRQALDLSEGDHVAFVERAGEVVLRPVRQSLRDLRGSVAVEGPQDAGAVRAAVHAARAERLMPGAPDADDRADAD